MVDLIMGLEILVELERIPLVTEGGLADRWFLEGCLTEAVEVIASLITKRAPGELERSRGLAALNRLLTQPPWIASMRGDGGTFARFVWPGFGGPELDLILSMGDSGRVGSVHICRVDGIAEDGVIYRPARDGKGLGQTDISLSAPLNVVYPSPRDIVIGRRKVDYTKVKLRTEDDEYNFSRQGSDQLSGVTVRFAKSVQDARYLVRVVESFRAALMSKASSPLAAFISGKRGDGVRLDSHQHPYLVPRLSAHGIDGIVIVTERKWSSVIFELTRKIKDLYVPSLHKTLIAGVTVGGIEDVFGAPAHYRVFQSYTPYVPSRYMHKNQDLLEFVTQDIAAELSRRGVNSDFQITPLKGNVIERPVVLLDRRTPRSKENKVCYGYELKIEMADATNSRLLLGRLNHFGTGVFRGVE